MIRLSQAQPIPNLEALRVHLQFAIGLELTTIPAYLCALYSIVEGENTDAVEAIQSVVIEEMLHMVLAANVLNAIGGVPSTRVVAGLGRPVPAYPTKVPFIERIPEISLLRFSPQAVDTFLAIEEPMEQCGASAAEEQYGSIGEFYDAIKDALRRVATKPVFEEARRKRDGCQVPPHLYYGGAGALLEVTDLDGALAALDQIVRQGEGVPEQILRRPAIEHVAAPPGVHGADVPVVDADVLPFGWRMYSHYARFREIREGRHYRPKQLVKATPAGTVLPIDWSAVHPTTPNPKAANYEGAYRAAMTECNNTYSTLIDTLYRSFNGKPDALEVAVKLMYDLKYQAVALMQTPSPLNPSLTLGPAFEYTPTR